ncbi:DNA polymerase III subunit alpha, putative [Babesia ovata]|uniref:DNA polymerase III subunit alpha, putative n=1 Tax=Babesia ovata TaxID=189622 RepID=A0A2H6K9B8_9APIC|nr:DNA polymerase III subunit alpha, putative [Babesia ovata]GBE59602.1 DNA polymerase III subunit alpha, putative [Babesia ovata]
MLLATLYGDNADTGRLELAGLRRRSLALFDCVRQVLHVGALDKGEELVQAPDEATVHPRSRRRREKAMTDRQRGEQRFVWELKRHNLRGLVVHAPNSDFGECICDFVGVLWVRDVGRHEG